MPLTHAAIPFFRRTTEIARRPRCLGPRWRCLRIARRSRPTGKKPQHYDPREHTRPRFSRWMQNRAPSPAALASAHLFFIFPATRSSANKGNGRREREKKGWPRRRRFGSCRRRGSTSAFAYPAPTALAKGPCACGYRQATFGQLVPLFLPKSWPIAVHAVSTARGLAHGRLFFFFHLIFCLGSEACRAGADGRRLVPLPLLRYRRRERTRRPAAIEGHTTGCHAKEALPFTSDHTAAVRRRRQRRRRS